MHQLDLFRYLPAPADPPSSGALTRPVIAPDTLKDEELLAALPCAGIADSIALAAEAGRRRMTGAVPALEALCRRFAGFGADWIVPEQAAAVDALREIAGSAAARALAGLIAQKIVQGPCLQQTIAAAAGLGAKLPASAVMDLLCHDDPQVRAEACGFAQPLPEIVARLRDLLDDLHRPVRLAAVCALGRIGRDDVRLLLARYLREEPSARLIDAVAPVADEDCVILLGRIARTIPHLAEAAIDALETIDHPRAVRIAAEMRVSPTMGNS